MMNSNEEIYSRFVKFGGVSTTEERRKITEIVKEWSHVPLAESNIDARYLETINLFVSDERINEILLAQPHLKQEMVKKLFTLLEKIDSNVERKPGFEAEEALISQFRKHDVLEQEGELCARSQVLTEELIENYEERKRTLLEEAEQLKEDRYSKLQKKISNNWKRLMKKQPNTSIGQQLQELSKDQEEVKLKEALDGLTPKDFRVEWKKWNATKEFIKKKYRKREFDLGKYQDEYDALAPVRVQPDPSKTAAAKKNFAEEWQKQFSLEKLHQDVKIIDETREKFLAELYEKIEELKELLKLLAPFLSETGHFGRLWDMSAGNWQRVNFRLLEEYAQLLKEKDGIQELAELLGRYQQAEAELEEEEFESVEIVSKYRVEHSGKAELVGVTESDDLNNVLPSELALFSDLETESIFYKRFSEKKLQTFKYVSKETDFEQRSVTDKGQKQIEKDKGPFILAVDTSGSMHGQPEFLAKVIAFAITRIAIEEKRKAFLISFSTEIETIELTDIQNSLAKLVAFLEMSFRGGTDASAAVLTALEQMKNESYEKADLLIISDGIFGKLSSAHLSSIDKLKKKGNKFNALMIGRSFNKGALTFCNNVWQHDPDYGDLKDLIRDVKGGL